MNICIGLLIFIFLVRHLCCHKEDTNSRVENIQLIERRGKMLKECEEMSRNWEQDVSNSIIRFKPEKNEFNYLNQMDVKLNFLSSSTTYAATFPTLNRKISFFTVIE